MGRNAWFNEDPDAQLLAVNEMNVSPGPAPPSRTSWPRRRLKVRKRFPEHFGQAEVRPEPEVQPEPRRAPPAVQGGTRTSEARTREKGFADIPPGDRALYQKHFARRFEESTGSKEAAEKKYAASYWRNKGDQ
jgi:hypothetical protein